MNSCVKLNEEQKFILQDDEGNLILVTEIELDIDRLQNGMMLMKGIKFYVDYEGNIIERYSRVDMTTCFKIDGIYRTE